MSLLPVVPIPSWGLVLAAGLWQVVKTAWVVSPEPITMASAREGAGPKGALVPLVVQPSSPPSMGSREQPWAPLPRDSTRIQVSTFPKLSRWPWW